MFWNLMFIGRIGWLYASSINISIGTQVKIKNLIEEINWKEEKLQYNLIDLATKRHQCSLSNTGQQLQQHYLLLHTSRLIIYRICIHCTLQNKVRLIHANMYWFNLLFLLRSPKQLINSINGMKIGFITSFTSSKIYSSSSSIFNRYKCFYLIFSSSLNNSIPLLELAFHNALISNN